MLWLTSVRACFILPGRRPKRKTRPRCRAPRVEKAAQAAIRADADKFEAIAQDWGYRIGSQIYGVYLAGKVKPSGLRRLFLAHLDEPGAASQSLHRRNCENPRRHKVAPPSRQLFDRRRMLI